MKLVNCEMAVKEIDTDQYMFLKNAMIDYYGMATYKNRNPKKEDKTFSISPIHNIYNKEVLRLHIPTSDPTMRSINEFGVHSKIDDYSCSIKDCLPEDCLKIFDYLNQICANKKVTFTFKIKNNMLVLINNNFIFHGRNKTNEPKKRLLRRVQFL